MIRGTTPTLTFTLPNTIDTGDITLLNLALSQRGQIIIEKDLADMTIGDHTVMAGLTESETLLLDSAAGTVSLQLRIGIGAQRLASQIIQTTVGAILKDGELT